MGVAREAVTVPLPAGDWSSSSGGPEHQPWNADETLITIENRGTRASPSPLILDGSTYEPKSGPCSNYPLWDYRWHPTLAHAHEQINVTADGLELMWFDVVSCTKTRSWTLPIAASYGIGSGKGNPSNDGRFVVIAATTRVYVVDMDPQPPSAPYPHNRIGPPLDVSDCGLTDCTIGWAGISASGKYGVVSYSGDHERVFEVDPRPSRSARTRCRGAPTDTRARRRPASSPASVTPAGRSTRSTTTRT